MITYRELHDMPEMKTISALQMKIWGSSPNAAPSPYVMMAAVHNGGVVIGAYDEDEIVGFCFGFAGKRHDNWLLWSHVAGVLPTYQGQGIGYALKQTQREWAAANDYDVIAWTFDPMQRGNANFNLRSLGAITKTYYANHYGEMTDALNMGMASDRLEAWWYTDETQNIVLDNAAPPLLVDNGILQPLPEKWDGAEYGVEIPMNLRTLKELDIAHAAVWQKAVREVMQTAFANGYAAVDFTTLDGRGWYVLRPHQ